MLLKKEKQRAFLLGVRLYALAIYGRWGLSGCPMRRDSLPLASHYFVFVVHFLLKSTSLLAACNKDENETPRRCLPHSQALAPHHTPLYFSNPTFRFPPHLPR